jgi:peptide deformylase
MSMPPILQAPDARLRVPTIAIVDFSEAVRTFCHALEMTRQGCRNPPAVGLAAPQVGALVKIVSLNPGKVVGHRFMINPVVIAHGVNKSWGEEGCMSISFGARLFRVKRWDIVTVRFQDWSGAMHEVVARAYAARVVQHEIDHLDGLMIDALAQKQAG